MAMLRFYRYAGHAPLSEPLSQAMRDVQVTGVPKLEYCFYVETDSALTSAETDRLIWLLRETFEPENFSATSFLAKSQCLAEVGPRFNFETSYSSIAATIIRTRTNIFKLRRLVRSRRYGIDKQLSDQAIGVFLRPLHDKMTEMRYVSPPETLVFVRSPDSVFFIDVLGEDGRANLRKFSRDFGLGWDDQDIELYYNLCRDVLKRNPTDVELFRLGQGNSNHCRHWDFNGRMSIDGQDKPRTLMQLIKAPWKANRGNSVLAFGDDSSAIQGREVLVLIPTNPLMASTYRVIRRTRHPTCTAETHCHPTMWEPYEGEATKEGIFRDEECIGRGGEYGIAGDGEIVGNLHIPGYEMPWEDELWLPAGNIATPLEIAIRGTDGAFDYGNAYGHPVTFGFFRTAGISVGNHRFESFKPIAYGVVGGSIDGAHLLKQLPESGMVLTLVGGPAYRIGIGGGSGSSMMGGENEADLDFNSVQRGDPWMGNLLHRWVRSCIELLDQNPIVTIHDLGAGGVANTATEIVEKTGGKVYVSRIPSGDSTLSVRELENNEAQERNCAAVRPEDQETVSAIAEREGCPIAFIGEVTDTGRFVLVDDRDNTTPVDLPLRETLAELPAKAFEDKPEQLPLTPVFLPVNLTIEQALIRVLRLPSVASKQWLTRKVDRSVTGLVAQQPCVGPNHLPLSDFAIKADSYFGLSGTAYSLGERPMIGLISPRAMARLVVTEALLNMAGARIDGLGYVKGSANWMLASKLPGQRAWLYDAMEALVEFFLALGIAADGGKDSMSMAAKAISPSGETVLVPSLPTLVFAAYATMPDITCKVTPYIDDSRISCLVHVDLAQGKRRLGGSALAQAFKQVGNEAPDMEDPGLLKRCFETVQLLVARNQINSLHDVSDGGLVVTLFEMAAASNLGLDVWLSREQSLFEILFAEEPGLVIGCPADKCGEVIHAFDQVGVPATEIAETRRDKRFRLMADDHVVFDQSMLELRSTWEETSYQLDQLQRNPECVAQERRNTVYLSTSPPYQVTFKVRLAPKRSKPGPKVAIIREEGSNGDREMAAMAKYAGFEAWDVHMNDLRSGRINLDEFRGVAFVGGFADRDVFDAAKGWAAGILFNLRDQFERFRNRPDTFSFGPCNGCQLEALLGWVPGFGLHPEEQPRFVQNESRGFESRFSTVTILESPAIMLAGMEGSTLGVWVSNREGRLKINEEALAKIERLHLAPLRYIDNKGEITEQYPFNPSGSPAGIASLCSADGRHLAMMPHPERTFMPWQWPWIPKKWKGGFKSSPWLQLLLNAYDWCMK